MRSNPLDYKLKLKALLHDPVHQQYVRGVLNKRHEIVAREILKYIFPDERIDEKEIEYLEQVVSAISRIVLAPKLSDEKKKEFKEESNVTLDEEEFIDPFSLIKSPIENPKSDNEVLKIFKELGSLNFQNQDERAQITFLFLWRFIPEIFPWIEKHPGDSRTPNHSIYEHLVQASAIVSSLQKPAFLLFTIGPVQEFIATARKPSDLWAGSYILSYLTYKAIEVIMEEFGPDHIIFPSLLKQPLVDRWIYKKLITHKDDFKKIENNYVKEWFKKWENHESERKNKEEDNLDFELTIANFPNRFLAILPYEKAKEIAEKSKIVIFEKLKNWTEKVEEEIRKLTVKNSEIIGREISEKCENIKQHTPKNWEEKIKKGFGNDILEICKTCIEQEPKNWTEKVKREIGDRIKNLNIKDSIIDHLQSYFKIYYVILPWWFDEKSINISVNEIIERYKEELEDGNEEAKKFGAIQLYSLDKILEEYQNLVGENKVYETVKIIREYPFYKPATVGSAYSLLVELVERFLASRKLIRETEQIQEQTYEKCHLCGNFDVLWLWSGQPNWANKKINAEIWKRFPEKIVRKNERLCGVCLTKRLFSQIIKDVLNLSEEVKFPSTSEMATVKYKLRVDNNLAEGFKKGFNDFRKKYKDEITPSISVPKLKNHPLYEIDGEWLFEESYKKEYKVKIGERDYEEVIKELKEIHIKYGKPTPYYAIVLMDGDNMGKWLKGDLMPKIEELIHKKVVKALLKYSEGEDKQRLQRLLCSRHPMSASFHFAFSRRISEFSLNDVRKTVEDNHYGKLIYAGGDDVLAFLPVDEVLTCAYELQKKFREILGEKASMSAGIAIVHHKYPLPLALKNVRDAEKNGKQKYGKNAFCIMYVKHSGELKEFGGKWDLKEFFDELICKFKNKEISSRFAYEFYEIIKSLNLPSSDEKIIEVVKNEIRRILRKDTEMKRNKDFEDKVIEIFDRYKDFPGEFGNMFIVAKEIGESM